MTVQLNILAKHGILIGAAAMAIFSATSYVQVMALKSIGEVGNENDDHSTQILKLCGLLALYLLGIALSALFISGIVKRRESFMTPWLVLSLIAALFVCLYAIYDVIKNRFNNMICVFYDTAGICVACIVVYPVFMLYLEVRDANMQRKRRLEQLQLVPEIGTGSNIN